MWAYPPYRGWGSSPSPAPYHLAMNEREPDHFRVQGPRTPRGTRASVPMFEFSIERSRELDRLCVERYGIPSIVLMENAAIGLAAHARAMLSSGAEPSVLILAGPGNNGGDGFALARHLHNESIPVRVVKTQSASSYSGDAAINLNTIQQMRIRIDDARGFLDSGGDRSAVLIVDALFGTGLSRAIEGLGGDLIDFTNQARQQRGARVLSVDCPSGLDVQRGEPLGNHVVHADRTVTFAGYKPGMARVEALEYLGEVHVVPIGAPIELLEELGRPIEARFRE